MQPRNHRDLVGGALLGLGGGWFTWYAAAHFQTGTVRDMGPGFFPVILGIALAGLGAAIAIPALFRAAPEQSLKLRVWSPLFVLSGIAGFAILIRPTGLIPAVAALILISSGAELKWRPLGVALLCAFACALAWGIFVLALGLPVQPFRWRF